MFFLQALCAKNYGFRYLFIHSFIHFYSQYHYTVNTKIINIGKIKKRKKYINRKKQINLYKKILLHSIQIDLIYMLSAIALFHTNKDTSRTNTATYTQDRFTSPAPRQISLSSIPR